MQIFFFSKLWSSQIFCFRISRQKYNTFLFKLQNYFQHDGTKFWLRKLDLKITFWWFLRLYVHVTGYKQTICADLIFGKKSSFSMLCTKSCNKSVVILILQSKGAGQMPAQIRLVCFLVQVLQFVQFFRWPTFTDTAFNWTLWPSTNNVLIFPAFPSLLKSKP